MKKQKLPMYYPMMMILTLGLSHSINAMKKKDIFSANCETVQTPARSNETPNSINLNIITKESSNNTIEVQITQPCGNHYNYNILIDDFSLYEEIYKILRMGGFTNEADRKKLIITVNSCNKTVESLLMCLLIEQKYENAKVFCESLNENNKLVPSFLCKYLADLTASPEHFYGDYFNNMRLKGPYNKCLFLTCNNIQNPNPLSICYLLDYINQQTWILTKDYCCRIKDHKEVAMLFDFMKRCWPCEYKRCLYDYLTHEGYLDIPHAYEQGFFQYLKSNNKLDANYTYNLFLQARGYQQIK